MTNDVSHAINASIDSNIDTMNELLSKLLYLCPTLFSINTAQWVDLLSCALDVRSIVFFLISQMQSYNKRVKTMMKTAKRLSDKHIKTFAAILVDIIDDMQENNILAVSYHIRTYFMADILKQDWESDKEFRRGQCNSYGITASVIVMHRLLNDIKTKAYRYPFFYINCCIQSMKLLVEMAKEEYMSISSLSRIRSKLFVLDLKYLVVSVINILHLQRNDSLYDENTGGNIDDYLWYEKKQCVFTLDFIGTINDVRDKVFTSSNKTLFTINESFWNKRGLIGSSNTTFSEQVDDQTLLDLIVVILEVQSIVFLLDKDNNLDDNSIIDTLENNFGTNNLQGFSIKPNERVGLDKIINLISDFQFDETLHHHYFEHNTDRISKSFIKKDILNLVCIDPIYINLILSKHYTSIGDDHMNFPLLTELETITRSKIHSLREKGRLKSNYISLD